MTNNKKIVIGIQGGKGSFNEQAVMDYITRHQITDYEIKYLYTTERVFQALNRKDIDLGQFALHNSIGGMVEESMEAMSRYTFEIVEDFAIPITHCLMKPKNVPFEKIDTFMAHPQVFKQCRNNLDNLYPNHKRISGAGDLIDHAKAAEEMSKGNIKENIAIIGPKILADLYDFEIVKEDLQDLPNNLTTFIVVKRSQDN